MSIFSRLTARLTLLLPLAALTGCDRIADIPIGTGFAAQNICSGVFVSQLPQDKVIQRWVAPQVKPLPSLWKVAVDTQARNVVVSDRLFGKLFAQQAHYREGVGCTLTQRTPLATLDAQVGPLPRASLTPGAAWPQGEAGPVAAGSTGADMTAVTAAIDAAFVENSANTRNTLAVAVIHKGQLIAEKYADGVTASTPLIGWSMSKSLTSTLVGLMADRGRLNVDAPAPVPEWAGTEKAPITTLQLLHMASGLQWSENSQGKDADQGYLLHRTRDFAAWYAAKPLVAAPGTVYNYSTGETSLIARIVQDAAGGSLMDVERFAREALFYPLGIASVVMQHDAEGHLSGGAHVLMSARDWARLGQLYLRNGEWNGQQVLSSAWIARALTPSPANANYGAQIRLNTGRAEWSTLPESTFGFTGHQEQKTIIVPDHDLVVVRLGYTFEGSVDIDESELLVRRIVAAL